MSEKFIMANTPWGQYKIPAGAVAADRATYFSEKGNDYAQEFDDTYNDDYELIDWLLNNMNWKDVVSESFRVNDEILVPFSDFWTSSDDFKVVKQ